MAEVVLDAVVVALHICGAQRRTFHSNNVCSDKVVTIYTHNVSLRDVKLILYTHTHPRRPRLLAVRQEDSLSLSLSLHRIDT